MDIEKVFESIEEAPSDSMKEEILSLFLSSMQEAKHTVPYESVQFLFGHLNNFLQKNTSSFGISTCCEVFLLCIEFSTTFEVEKAFGSVINTLLVHLADTEAEIREKAFEVFSQYFKKTTNIDRILKAVSDFGFRHESPAVRAALCAMTPALIEMEPLIFEKKESLFLSRKLVEGMLDLIRGDDGVSVRKAAQESLSMIFKKHPIFYEKLKLKMMPKDIEELTKIAKKPSPGLGSIDAEDEFVIPGYGRQAKHIGSSLTDRFPEVDRYLDQVEKYFKELADEVFIYEDLSKKIESSESEPVPQEGVAPRDKETVNRDSKPENQEEKEFQFISKQGRVFGMFSLKTVQDALKFQKDWRVRAYALEEITLALLRSENLDQLFPYTFTFAKFVLFQFSAQNNQTITLILLTLASRMMEIPGLNLKFETSLLFDQLIQLLGSEKVSIRSLSFSVVMKTCSLVPLNSFVKTLISKLSNKRKKQKAPETWIFHFEVIRILINVISDSTFSFKEDSQRPTNWLSTFYELLEVLLEILAKGKTTIPKVRQAIIDLICLACKTLPESMGLQFLDSKMDREDFAFITDRVLEFQFSNLAIEKQKAPRDHIFDQLISEELSKEFLKEAERYHKRMALLAKQKNKREAEEYHKGYAAGSDVEMRISRESFGEKSFYETGKQTKKGVRFDLLFEMAKLENGGPPGRPKDFGQFNVPKEKAVGPSKAELAAGPEEGHKEKVYFNESFNLEKRINEEDEKIPHFQKSKNMNDYMRLNQAAFKKYKGLEEEGEPGKKISRKNFDSLDDFISTKHPESSQLVDSSIYGEFIEEPVESEDEGYDGYKYPYDMETYQKNKQKYAKKMSKQMVHENHSAFKTKQRILEGKSRKPKVESIKFRSWETLPRLKDPEAFADRAVRELFGSKYSEDIIEGLNGIRSIIKWDQELIFFNFFPLSQILEKSCLFFQSNSLEVIKASLILIKDFSFHLKWTIEPHVQQILGSLLGISEHENEEIRADVIRVVKTIAKHTSGEKDLLDYFLLQKRLGKQQGLVFEFQGSKTENKIVYSRGLMAPNERSPALLSKESQKKIESQKPPQAQEPKNQNAMRASYEILKNSASSTKIRFAASAKVGIEPIYNPQKEANSILEVIKFFN